MGLLVSMPDWFGRIVAWANSNDGAIQAAFTLVLVILGVAGWWVARQDAFGSVLPVLVLDVRSANDEEDEALLEILVQNVGIGPAIDVKIRWELGTGRSRQDIPVNSDFAGIQPGGERVLLQRSTGVDRISDFSGEGPFTEELVQGTATVTYQDVHKRAGVLKARLVVRLYLLTVDDHPPLRWLLLETVSSRPPGRS